MKPKIHLSTATFTLAVVLAFSAQLTSRAGGTNYNSILGTNNPLAYWTFSDCTNCSPPAYKLANSGSLGSVADAYANAHVTNGVGGKVNNCLRLDNPAPVADCDSKADVVWNAGLNSPVFSVEFWVNPGSGMSSGDSTGLCPVSNFSNNGGTGASRIGWLFYVPPTGVWNFRMGLPSGYAANLHGTNYNAAVGTWQHVCATYDGTTVTLYINGQIAAAATASTAGFGALPSWSPNPNSFLRIGGTPLTGGEDALTSGLIGGIGMPLNNNAPLSGNRGWDGLLDELAVYTNALSAARVLAHYNAATNSSTYGTVIQSDGPTGYWNFDEPAVTVPTSFPTSASSGTLGDATATNFWGAVDGYPGPGYGGFNAGDKAVWYDAVSGNSAVHDSAGLHFSNQISLVAWVKPTANTYYQDILEHGPDINDAETFLRISRQNGNVGNAGGWGDYGQSSYYEVGSSEGLYGSDNYYDGLTVPMPQGDIGNWVFLVGTFDGSLWRLYRNGVLAGTLTPDAEDMGAYDVTNGWTIGSRQSPNTYGNPVVTGTAVWEGHCFAGAIAEPAILSNALSDVEVLALYNAAHVPPVITGPVTLPPGIYKGSPAAFNVWAEGNATLGYEWYSNNVPTGVTATNYTISSLAAGPLTVAVVVTNSWGSITSAVSTVIVASKPLIVQQPVAVTRYVGRPFAFSVTAAGTQPISYQWATNNVSIPGATSSSYSGTVGPATAGSYSCILSNEAGTSNSVSVVLTSLVYPAGYQTAVLNDSPLSFWRLAETSGTVAHDFWSGNDGAYVGVTLGQPGFSVINPDTAATFSGINSYVGNISGTAVNFTGFNQAFTLEAWVNGAANQNDESTIIAKGIGNGGGSTTRNEQFSLDLVGGNFRFFTTRGNTVYEADATVGPDQTWQHVVGVYDATNSYGNGSNQMYIFVNGALSAHASGNPFGLNNTASPVSIGSKRTSNDPNYDGVWEGSIDEVAVYPYALSSIQVSNHYAAAYGPSLPPLITVEPLSTTNYEGLSSQFSVGAGGTQPLSYQWYHNTMPLTDGLEIFGSQTETLTVGHQDPISLAIYGITTADAGTYSVTITNVNGRTNSASVVLTVLPPPSSPPVIPGLVTHLTFNGTLADATGRGNNATGIHLNRNHGVTSSNTVAPTYVTGPYNAVQGMSFSTTDIDGYGTNFDNFYASLGKNPPDLQFSTNINFSVAFWIQAPANYIGNDLPFFTDGVGSTFATPGLVFCYSYGTTAGTAAGYAGSWAYSVLDSAANGLAGRGEIGSISDNNWHHLVHVFNRAVGQTTYLDGFRVPFHKQSGTSLQAAGSFDNSSWWTIGQDPTGLYNQATEIGSGATPPGSTYTSSGNISDLGVWKHALTPLEAGAIFSAMSSNHVSYTSAPIFITVTRSGNSVTLSWPEGTLQSSSNDSTGFSDLTSSPPYTFTPSGVKKFYRVRLY